MPRTPTPRTPSHDPDPYRFALAGRKAVGALIVAGLLLVGLLLGGTQVDGQAARYLRLGTGPVGGTYFPIGGLIASVISSPPGSPSCDLGGSCGVPGLIASAQATNGSIDNLQRLHSGRVEAALVQADVAYAAHLGRLPLAEDEPTRIRAIASLYTEVFHVIVADGVAARSVSDLAGLRVSLGPEGSGTLATSELVLAAHGMSPSDLRAHRHGLEKSADLLIAGELDAIMVMAGTPATVVEDLAARAEIRLLDLDGPPIQDLLADSPFVTISVVPADTYAGLPALLTIGVPALLVVREDLEVQLVAELTAALWHERSLAVIAAGHPRGADITAETAVQAGGIPLHTGAIRYYSERGVLAVTGDG